MPVRAHHQPRARRAHLHVSRTSQDLSPWQSHSSRRLLRWKAQVLTTFDHGKLPPMPTPLDPRKKPTSVKIHVSSGTGVDIIWADGHASHYDFAYLRDECPCATCNDERG